ncbi:MAG TPA: aminopeptidase [Minicystis sp.]|nr:aminopeptidase [Minicystis sp.]
MRILPLTIGSDEIAHAASMVVSTSLRLAPRQRLVVFADHGSRDLAQALHAAARDARGAGEVVWLDPLRAAPLKVLPEDVVERLGAAQASVFVASSRTDELPMRQHLLHLVAALGLRHAHMPSISRLAFARGLRVDYREVAAAGRRLLAKVVGARSLHVKSPFGTDLTITFDERPAWFSQLGVLDLGRWGNLPAGALYATPASADGVFVASASVGEFFGAREGLLRDKPVRFELEGGRVTHVAAPRAPDLERDLAAMLRIAPQADRVGLVSLGVNGGITSATGEALVDQNLPGLHLGIGDPATHTTGATWSARAAFAACGSAATVTAEGAVLVKDGRLVEPA